jgi:hypothetical protein
MEDDTLLLTTCIDAVVNLSNAAVNKLTPAAQQALNAAIQGGAKIEVIIQIVPSVAVRGTVSNNGQTAQLFEVSFPFQPSELLN